MEYEYVFERDGKEVERKAGNEDLKKVLRKLDELIVKQK